MRRWLLVPPTMLGTGNLWQSSSARVKRENQGPRGLRERSHRARRWGERTKLDKYPEMYLLVKSSRSSCSASAANSSGVFFFLISGFGSSWGGCSTISSFFLILYCWRKQAQICVKRGFLQLCRRNFDENDLIGFVLNLQSWWIICPDECPSIRNQIESRIGR